MARKLNLRVVAIEKYGIELKELLTDMYWNKGMKQREIAEEFGCVVPSISLWFTKFKIPLHPNGTFQRETKQSERVIEIIRKTHTGKIVSSETRKKLSESRKRWSPIGKSARFTGKRQRVDGYIQLYLPDHPYATKDGYVMEHRVVMEKMIGRYLLPSEEVHHINEVKHDNRQQNLHLFKDKQEHMRYHMKKRHSERRNKIVNQ